MKKALSIILGIIIILVAILYFSKNLIIKIILENKLTQINKGRVDIGSVKFSPFDKNITIENIDFTSRKDGMKNFVSIGKFEADYDIYFDEKKILISEANFDNVQFMTGRKTNGSIGFVVEEPNSAIISNMDKIRAEKNASVENLKELISARARVNKVAFDNIAKAQFDRAELILENKKDMWKKRLRDLERTPEYAILIDNYNKISREKNPLKILKMDREIKNMLRSFKFLSREFLEDRESMREDFKRLLSSQNLEDELERSVKSLVNRGEFIITDLDSIINYYLNEIYGEQIKDIVVKYRNIMREVELRRDEDRKADNVWEVFVEEIKVESTLFGIKLNGGIKNISSRLSKNKSTVDMYLTADSDATHGEAYGFIDLNTIQGKIYINIPSFDFNDLKDMKALNRYVTGGEASLVKDILLSRDDISISGDVKIEEMCLNPQEITAKMNLTSSLLNNMVTPLLQELKSGNVHYSYDSISGKLTIKSDLSDEITNLLNDRDGVLKKQIVEDMLRDGKKEIDNYKKTLDRKNSEALKDLEKSFDEKNNYLQKVEDVLDRYNLKELLEKI